MLCRGDAVVEQSKFFTANTVMFAACLHTLPCFSATDGPEAHETKWAHEGGVLLATTRESTPPAIVADDTSELQLQRLRYKPTLPEVLRRPALLQAVVVEEEEPSTPVSDVNTEWGSVTCTGDTGNTASEGLLRSQFPRTFSTHHQVHLRVEPNAASSQAAQTHPPRPLRVGVVLSGGPAPGGHNVVGGLLDALESMHTESVLLGFKGGPKGILHNEHVQLDRAAVNTVRNVGGFHLLGTGRDKIESPADLEAALKVCDELLQLDGLVVVGGDDSNTNAAYLAEYFAEHNSRVRVLGVPKTIDGDVKSQHVPISFGFDSATKVYSELCGNILLDAHSANKYYHFVRLMGRSSSHITLEVALQTHPQMALVGEEVAARGLTLEAIVADIADLVTTRHALGLHHGVILIPEGLVEFVPSMRVLIAELNDSLGALAEAAGAPCDAALCPKLSDASTAVFNSLPADFRASLLQDRDPHGNLALSSIETERLLIRMVGAELVKRATAGTYDGKFRAVPSFFGYEARCTFPSNFDATYCNTLGHAAVALIGLEQTGLLVTVRNPWASADSWEVGGCPLTSLMHVERRAGVNRLVVQKTPVDLNGAPFRTFTAARGAWRTGHHSKNQGPMQFAGDASNLLNATLTLEGAARIALELQNHPNGNSPTAAAGAPAEAATLHAHTSPRTHAVEDEEPFNV